MINLEEQIKLLVELQGLDSQIFKIDDELVYIPERIKSEEGKFKDKGDDLKALEDGLKSLQVKRKEKEVDLAAKEGVIKKYQSQLFQIKTNKEYSALQDEIGRARADNSLVEEDIIRIFDEIDIANKKIQQEKELLKQEESKLNEEKKKLNEEASRIKLDVDKLKAQRAELSAKIDKNVLSKYERIVKNKDGLAVVSVANYACQGCFRVLPAQVINEIRMKTELVFCDNCTRILYIEE